MSKIIICALLLLLCFPINTFTQDQSDLVKQIEQAFIAKEPKWKIDRTYAQSDPPVLHLKSTQGVELL